MLCYIFSSRSYFFTQTKHILLPEDLEDIAVEDLTHVEHIQEVEDMQDVEVSSDGHFIEISDPQAQV